MTTRRPLIVSAIIILAMAALSLVAAAVLPATVPLRFACTASPRLMAARLCRWC